eukprot:TRINITY_DN6093_c0_g1_i1.p1 TRINITY_DN6093_c0_g1~~TRINITY_DN6093_c0_g1_i1.p1  ORF type:complete len:416 (-),score=55.27 TRINITY_DN6093_c0_g1_i1:55-1302(-)
MMELLEMQLAEFELLTSMYFEDEISYSADQISLAKSLLENRKGEVSSTLPLLTCTIRIAVEGRKNLCTYLQANLPPRYPEEPPQLSISCDCISPGSHKLLLTLLSQYANSLSGEVCIASCVAWLQEHISPHVELFLQPQELINIGDPSVGTECSICITDFSGEEEELVTLSQCKHKFCKECLSDYITFKSQDVAALFHHVTVIVRERTNILKIDDGDTYGIPCPARKCEHVMLFNELQPLATPEALHNFTKFSKVHQTNMEEVARERERELQAEKAKFGACPRCNSTDIRPGPANRLICCGCFLRICKSCRGGHGGSVSCARHAEIQREKEAQQLALSLARGDKNRVVRCPACFVFIQKTDGCNYLTCRCGQGLCNVCSCALSPQKHFLHFPAGPFTDVCLGPNDADPIETRKKR